jgi:Flp pilus assembly protein TadB
MIMNNNQKRQLILAGCFVVLMILWLFVPGWRAAKILGIIANALLLLSMLVSYRAEERMKKKDKE